MDVVEKDDLARNSRNVGDRLQTGLRKLQLKDERVGDVRGMGLMIGVELVKDKKSKEFAADLAIRVVESMKEQGVLIGKGGLEGNTLRIQPPLCWTLQDADRTVAALEQALKDAPAGPAAQRASWAACCRRSACCTWHPSRSCCCRPWGPRPCSSRCVRGAFFFATCRARGLRAGILLAVSARDRVFHGGPDRLPRDDRVRPSPASAAFCFTEARPSWSPWRPALTCCGAAS